MDHTKGGDVMEIVRPNGTEQAKEFCCKCHMSFGTAEPRVAIDQKRVMHEDCYVKHLHHLSLRTQRITRFVH